LDDKEFENLKKNELRWNIDLKPLILGNIVLFYSFLRLEWFVVSFIIIAGLEAVIINHFLKDDFQQAIRISIIGNIISTIAAIPLLTFPILSITEFIPSEGSWVTHGADNYSLWLIPIVFGFGLVKTLPTEPPIKYDFVFTDFPITILFFAIALILSFLIEFGYAKMDFKFFKKTEIEDYTKLCRSILWANITSYIVIFGFLIVIGVVLGLFTGVTEPVGFLSENLFVNQRGYSFFDMFIYYTMFFIITGAILGSVVAVVIFMRKNYAANKDEH